jgi:hypothetical protein
MKLKRTMLAVLAGTAAMLSLPALADNGRHGGHRHGNDHRHGHGHSHGHGYGHYSAPRAFVVVPPPRVVYAPRVVYPAPVYYHPAPRYYQPAPVYAPAPVSPGISIRFRLPL